MVRWTRDIKEYDEWCRIEELHVQQLCQKLLEQGLPKAAARVSFDCKLAVPSLSIVWVLFWQCVNLCLLRTKQSCNIGIWPASLHGQNSCCNWIMLCRCT